MPEEGLKHYSPEEVLQKIQYEIPQWKYEDGYICREINTKNWKETVMLFNAIAYSVAISKSEDVNFCYL